jgi:hypothetical protein
MIVEIVERLDRPRLQHPLRRCEVDQVIRVNDQRPQAQLVPTLTERLCVHFWNPRRPALPHPGACRKNLQRVAAQFARRFQRVQVASCDGGVDANPQAAIHPRWGLRFRLRFRAIFVFGVEFCLLKDGLFRHAQ